MKNALHYTLKQDLSTAKAYEHNGLVSSKNYDKRNDFNFEIVNFTLLDEDVPHSPYYGVYISQRFRFARVCSNVDDFNNTILFLTAKILKQGIIKFKKYFLNSTTNTQSQLLKDLGQFPIQSAQILTAFRLR